MGKRRHGTNSCYSMGCRRKECKAAHAEYQMASRRFGASRSTPVDEYREWLMIHTMPRFSIDEIAERAGLSAQHLRDIRDGKTIRVQGHTAAKLNAIIAEVTDDG